MTNQTADICPICQSPLKEMEVTKNGKKLQRCSRGSWDAEKHAVVGCEYVKWINDAPQLLDEKCPQCQAPLVMQVTRNGKRMKKCSTNGWDRESRQPTGCTYVEWLSAA